MQYKLSINSQHSLVHDFTKGSLQLMSKHIQHQHAVKGFMFLDAHTQRWVVILEPLTSKLISMKSQRVFADTIFLPFDSTQRSQCWGRMMVVPENYILSGKEWGPRFIELDALSNVSFTQRVICTHNNPFYVHKDLLGTASNEAFNLLNPSSRLILPEGSYHSQFLSTLHEQPHFVKDLEGLLSTLPSVSDLLNILRIQHATFYQYILEGAYADDLSIMADDNLMKHLKLNLDALNSGEFRIFSDFSENLGTSNWARQTKTNLVLPPNTDPFGTLPIKLKTREEFTIPFN